MIKIYLKNMNVYLLHRDNELDHKKGRPAILLNYKSESSLVWWGTTKWEKFDKEIPLIIKLNKINGYFYSKGLEKVRTKDLKNYWVNFENYVPYTLSHQMQKKLISKFASFTDQKDPYQKIVLLELEIETLKRENRLLKQEKEINESVLEWEIE